MCINTAFGKTIKKFRKTKQFSQAKLAELSGLHLNSLHLLEKGENEPRLSTFCAIAKGLGMTPTILMQQMMKQM